jgi:hypothetical protein
MLYSFAAQGMLSDQNAAASLLPRQFELCREFYRISKEEQNLRERIQQIVDSGCHEREPEKGTLEEVLAVEEQNKERTRESLYTVFFEEWRFMTRPLISSEM